MQLSLDNWRVQVKKGYLELCLLLLIRKHRRLYGLELLEKMDQLELSLKEGTLYPLLSRMTEDGLLQANWETENLKGHPRKFYSLTKKGQQALGEMQEEFERMIDLVSKIQK
ncbi:MAG TPA: helix-turn-helix transcriptional regulator [Bdellovibrionales bacterium]|nr:helix-turn-helix transcriptional regulator [Bdellovibrionales bacterium]